MACCLIALGGDGEGSGVQENLSYAVSIRDVDKQWGL